MTDGDPYPLSDVAPEPGMRWVEVYDGRLTNRVRLDQVPITSPDPEVVEDSPEQSQNVRVLVNKLLLRRPMTGETHRRDDNPGSETP